MKSLYRGCTLEEDVKKYAERAAQVLLEFSRHERSNLKPPEEAAKELIESEKNLKSVEAKFNVNSMDILYNYMKVKYPAFGVSKKVEKLIKILKALSDKDNGKSRKEGKAVYKQLIVEMRKVEDNIKANNPDYQKKIT